MISNGKLKIISGNSNISLGKSICKRIGLLFGTKVKPVKARVERFSDQEVFVEVFENVRGEDMFIVQSTSNPANDNLMELLIIADALKRSSASRVTAIIPYFGYARQDRRTKARTPISAKLVANLLAQAGINRVLTLDLHAAQIQGFFDIPVDNLYASPIFAIDIRHNFANNKNITIENIPLEAYEYVVNGKPALEWVMERQCIKTDKIFFDLTKPA